jgi:hypothetical protein
MIERSLNLREMKSCLNICGVLVAHTLSFRAVSCDVSEWLSLSRESG